DDDRACLLVEPACALADGQGSAAAEDSGDESHGSKLAGPHQVTVAAASAELDWPNRANRHSRHRDGSLRVVCNPSVGSVAAEAAKATATRGLQALRAPGGPGDLCIERAYAHI